MHPHDIFTYGGVMVYCFDLDGTICSLTKNNEYPEAIPFPDMVEAVNNLYETHCIKIFTARGASSGIDWTDLTTKQLSKWGVKYHELIMGQKPSFDIFIDDKAVNAEEWRSANAAKIAGIIAGSFDVMHPGYIKLFKDAKSHCNHLTVCLHTDPSLYSDKKIPPALCVEDRVEILSSIKYIDNIVTYNTELDLKNLLMTGHYDIRIVGTDYLNKPITGRQYTQKTIFHDRHHGWSTTRYKKRIYENYKDSIGIDE